MLPRGLGANPAGVTTTVSKAFGCNAMKLTLVFSSLLLALTLSPVVAAELRQETLRTWDAYVKSAESSMDARCSARGSFLWIYEVPARAQLVHQGDILVAAVGENGPRTIPGGLIHDWVGAVFVPNTTLDSVIRVAQDYDRYKRFYGPAVADSKTTSRAGDRHTFSMRWVRQVLFVTAVFDNDHEARYFRRDDRRWYSVDRTTQIQEVENYGRQNERKLPAGSGSGYLWRVHSISRYEERDGGVYLEMEVIGLSRDVPAYIRWLVNPIIGRLPRELLRTTLQQTRDAILALPDAQN